VTRYVAFLRAINVGGRNVRMETLRRHFEELGFARVETHIASGNVVFESRSADEARLVKRIEGHLADALGFEVDTFLRTDGEVAAIARHRPFEAAALVRAGAFCVGFLAAPLSAPAREALARLETDIDRLHARGREVYWLCRKRQSESDFSNAVLERRLGVRATFRGMPTVTKLAARFPPAR
jgi:uncharacterized protein (DUF1697 family)